LNRHDILSFFERNPSRWLEVIKLLCERLRQTDRAFADVALLELPIRLAKVMLRIINREAKSEEARQAKIQFSQRELANMVGGTRESVNKCLRNWQRSGFVQISEGSIIVTDPSALEELAEMSS